MILEFNGIPKIPWRTKRTAANINEQNEKALAAEKDGLVEGGISEEVVDLREILEREKAVNAAKREIDQRRDELDSK